ncbi:MAG: serine dehydratase subunit alpha family protein [Bacillota bacterium]
MKKLLIDILKDEVKPAMGCTEPIAVCLATAKAREILKKDNFDKIKIKVSPNIYKNGLAVGIPHTDFVGLDIAAAVGFLDGDSKDGLELLKNVKDKNLKKAKQLAKNIDLDIADTDKKIYIDVVIKSKEDISQVTIEKKHDKFTYIKKNDKIILDKKIKEKDKKEIDLSEFYKMKVIDIINEVEKMDKSDLKFMLDGYHMNLKMAKKGLEKKYGMGVGYQIKNMVDKNIYNDNLMNKASYLTAGASDARMSGVNLEVMSSNGSGNNGLTAILPIVAYSQLKDVSQTKIAKAIAISHLINNYIKNEIGRLSAICSCSVSAGSSSSAAIVWLEGGTKQQIEGTIKNMIGNVSGMVCDGAKEGCAMKLSTAANLSALNAKLALNDSIVPHKNGIVNKSVEKTIKNLGILSKKGMKITDKEILNIMLEND